MSGQETPAGLVGRALIFHYARPGTTATPGCDSQDPVTFKVELELKYPTTSEGQNVMITATNVIPSSETVRDPAGQLQRKVVDVQVQCRDRPSVPECVSNTRVGAECTCGAQTCSPTDSRINYCMEEDGVKSCTSYNTCEPRNRLGVAPGERQAITEYNWCDCDGDSNNRMECPRSATCNEITASGNWQCSNPRIFELVRPPQPPTPAPSARIERPGSGVDRWTPDIQAVCQGDTNCVALVKAFMRSESGGNPYAVSWSGCAGLMQFCYTTAEGMDVFSPGPLQNCCENYVRTPDRTVPNRCMTSQNHCKDQGYTDIRFHPQRNIYAGASALLRKQRDSRVRGNIYLLAVSYNAGMGIVPHVVTRLEGRTPTPENIEPIMLASLLDHPNYQRWDRSKLEQKARNMVPYMRGIARRYAEEYGGVFAGAGQLPEMRALPAFESISFSGPEAIAEPSAIREQIEAEEELPRIIVVGHSFVESETAPLVVALEEAIGKDIVAAGRRGWTVPRWMSAGDASDVVAGYSVVLVVLNNQQRHVSASDIVTLDSRLGANGARVIWIGDAPRPEGNPWDGTEHYQWDALHEAAFSGVEFVLAEDWDMPPEGYSAVDGRDRGLHITRTGARIWAERLAPLLRERLAAT